MAYVVNCDDCGTELERGDTGRPGTASRDALCKQCAGISALVEQEIRRRGQEWALDAATKLDAMRKQLRAEMRGVAPADGSGWRQSLPRVG